MSAPSDWTRHWTRAAAIGITAWTRAPRLLSDEEAAREIARRVGEAAARAGGALLAVGVVPDAIHVVGAVTPLPRQPWPEIVGLARGGFTRWDNIRRGARGPAWRARVRIVPLEGASLTLALRRLAEMNQRLR